MSTSLLVTGGKGQLGRDVLAAAARAGITEVRAPGSAELDITDAAAVADAVAAAAALAGGGSRLVVINTAAYTAVDAAESQGAARAQAVNAAGPANLARACLRCAPGATPLPLPLPRACSPPESRSPSAPVATAVLPAYSLALLAGPYSPQSPAPAIGRSCLDGPGRSRKHRCVLHN